MDTNYLENNYLTLVGKVTGEKKFSHEIYGESFYIFNLMIPRLSGNSDIIPITVSERLIKEDTLQEGNKLLVKGQFRSYNSYENERNRLILTVFAKDITELEDDNEEEIEENEKDFEEEVTNIKINIWSTSMLHTTVPTVLPKDTATEYSLLLVWVGVSPKNRSSRITFLSSNY